MRELCNVITFLSLFMTFSLGASAAESKIPVVASFSILGDFAKTIGGDRVEVTTLVGPNGDAHVYQPSPNDAKNLHAAKLILVNGLKLEGWIDRLIKASGSTAPIIVATKGIEPLQMKEEGRIGLDPHAWQRVANAKIYCTNIRDGLIAIDPADAAIFQANTKAYLEKLDSLETLVKTEIDKIPQNRRAIITTHDAFGYFGKAYGFSFIAPQGVSTEAEPSAKDLAKIIRQIKTEKIPAVFLENISDPRAGQRIADESGAKLGGTLYSDALSPPDGPASTYIDMVEHNVAELGKALNDTKGH
jgi:zinc/manganese transport system substrate-binding protein